LVPSCQLLQFALISPHGCLMFSPIGDFYSKLH
jgi:hypothetical protein